MRPQSAPRRGLPALDLFNEARGVTLESISQLDQAQLDATPQLGRWSLGEIFDHLIRVDRMFLREVSELVQRQRQGQIPLIFRSLRDLGAPGGSLPLPFRLPIEGTLAFGNIAFPARLRELAFRQRAVRVQAPQRLEPRAKRGKQELIADLQAGPAEVQRLENTPDVSLRSALYYSPLAGWSGIDGLIRLIAQHDRRHQAQIQEARAAVLAGEGRPGPHAHPSHAPDGAFSP